MNKLEELPISNYNDLDGQWAPGHLLKMLILPAHWTTKLFKQFLHKQKLKNENLFANIQLEKIYFTVVYRKQTNQNCLQNLTL